MPRLFDPEVFGVEDIPRVEARGVVVTAVSAVTEKGIVRGIAHFKAPHLVKEEVRKAIGVLTEAQWSRCSYRFPSYLRSIGGQSGWDVAGGIYLFRWDDAHTTNWRDPEHRLAVQEPELLWRPMGWSSGRAGCTTNG